MDWVYRARTRFGLRVLDFVVTCNHVHLLALDIDGAEVISNSMQIIAGRTAQEYNLRKRRRGAFWEDRYHATAIENGRHLANCLSYIDLNMVRAGRVDHPIQWVHGGYHELQKPPRYKRLVDYEILRRLLGVRTLQELRMVRRRWVEEKIASKRMAREGEWTESIAVGSREFLEKMKKLQGPKVRRRALEPLADPDAFQLKEGNEIPYLSGPKSRHFAGRRKRK